MSGQIEGTYTAIVTVRITGDERQDQQHVELQKTPILPPFAWMKKVSCQRTEIVPVSVQRTLVHQVLEMFHARGGSDTDWGSPAKPFMSVGRTASSLRHAHVGRNVERRDGQQG